MTRYRDTVTGRFVSAATWRRSHAHGGTRYKRQAIARPQVAQPTVRVTAPPSQTPDTGGGSGTITGPIIPTEFLTADNEMFEPDEDYEFAEDAEY